MDSHETGHKQAVFPHKHVPWEVEWEESDRMAARGVLELFAPLALGQRGLIVGPRSSGRTSILGMVGTAIAEHFPEAEIAALLIDQPFDAFIEWRSELPGIHVSGTTMDDPPAEHAKMIEVIEHAFSKAESGSDQVILIDSLTGLARALNVVHGHAFHDDVIDRKAMLTLRTAFGRARAWRGEGSLTIVGTLISESDDPMDEAVMNELIGTGNMEVRLACAVRDIGVFPPVDIETSGTRNEDGIIGEAESRRRAELKSIIENHGNHAALNLLVDQLDGLGSLSSLLDNFVGPS